MPNRHSSSTQDSRSLMSIPRTITWFSIRLELESRSQTKGGPARPVDERTNYQSKNYFKINFNLMISSGLAVFAKKLDSVWIRFLEFKPFDIRLAS